MGMVVRSNIMAVNANRQLGINNSKVSKSIEKLSSGFKINRAGDDASGLAISEKMKAQIKGLDTASANSQDGISLIQTAEGALTEVHDMLNRMVELAGKSANGTMDQNVDRASLQKELDALKGEIDRVAQATNFNGIKLLDGSLGTTSSSGTSVNVKYSNMAANPDILKNMAATLNTTGVAAGSGVTGTTVGAGNKLNLQYIDQDGNLQNKSIEFTGSHVSLKDASNDAALTKALQDALGDGFTASIAAGVVDIKAKDAGSANQFQLIGISASDASGNAIANAFGAVTNAKGADAYQQLDVSKMKTFTGAAGENYEDFMIEINGEKFAFATAAGATALGAKDPSINVVTLGAATAPATGDRAAMVTLINNKTGIKAEADGTAATGINLKAGTKAGTSTGGLTLQIGDTAESFNQVTVSINSMGTRGLGIGNISVADQVAASKAQSMLKNANGGGAINVVSATRADLGALQNRLEHTINNLDVSSENMNSANSRIRDTDMAKEMMEYTKMNVLTQAAQAMLAQANQQPQSVLQLLQ